MEEKPTKRQKTEHSPPTTKAPGACSFLLLLPFDLIKEIFQFLSITTLFGLRRALGGGAFMHGETAKTELDKLLFGDHVNIDLAKTSVSEHNLADLFSVARKARKIILRQTGLTRLPVLRCTKLDHLDLSGCIFMTDAGLATLRGLSLTLSLIHI